MFSTGILASFTAASLVPLEFHLISALLRRENFAEISKLKHHTAVLLSVTPFVIHDLVYKKKNSSLPAAQGR